MQYSLVQLLNLYCMKIIGNNTILTTITQTNTVYLRLTLNLLFIKCEKL